ncbi:hypothetical protein JCM33374_g2706 [Metschnikowia sp. JCM 33374]|nr:hypothetical protein JCM33374_g2706 [Metschnikowia sp. JCM 33374]
MANQQESPTKSPERKKPRPLAKPRKTYIFQPKNTLAFNPQVHSGLRQWRSPQGETFVPPSEHIKTFATSNHEAPQNSRPHPLVSDSHPHTANIDSLASGTASHTRGDGYTSAPSGPSPQPHAPSLTPTPARIFDRSSDQQSSDDSFDGVRWRPAHSPQRFARPILSSPLRNGEIPPHKIPPAGTLVNEITDSMLSKYGMDIPTTNSHTPLFSRTTSDGVVASLDVSPTLARSKSFDPRCLPQGKAPGAESAAEKASRLSTWIDKFEDKPIQQTAADALVNQTPPQQAAPYDDDDTLSSDDDSFLANLNSKSLPLLSQAVPALQTAPTLETTPNPPQTLLSDATKKPSMSPKHCAPSPQKPRVRVCSPHEENDSFDDDSDPFSDDIDIAAIDSVFTQPSTAQSSFATPHSDGVSPALDLKNSEIKSVSPKQDRSYEEKSFGAKISYSRPDFSRYQVKSVFSTSYQVQGFKRKQLILTVADQNDIVSKLMVRGETADLDIKASDVVHVIHTTPENPRLISDSHNLLIWHPDTLVSSTVVADQLECPRKTVLNKRLSFPGSHSIPLLAGTIVHELFQACFITGKCTSEYMESLLELEIQRRLLDIYTLGDVVDELKDKIRSHLPYIQKWFATFFRRAPAEIPTNKRNQKVRFSVAEALDIEERVWSPMFGIKGIADVTLKANLASENSTGQFLVPMEIKTGQPYIHHQAQAALYSLLYKDRYNVDIASFLLVYTSNEGSTTKHDISIPDLKSLVNLRNRISIYLQPGNQVLPGLMRQQKCDRCFVQSSCMTYNYLTENGTAEDSGLKDGVFEDLTAHLEGNEEYKDFLAYWDHLLSKEEEFVSRFDKELWVLTAKEREESSGKSLGSLIISNCETNNNTDEYIYTFKRNGPQGRPFNACQISKYDRIIVSDESGHFALAQGFVRHIEAESIIIASRRQIISTESKTDRFHRAGVLRASQRTSQENVDVVLFRGGQR